MYQILILTIIIFNIINIISVRVNTMNGEGKGKQTMQRSNGVAKGLGLLPKPKLVKAVGVTHSLGQDPRNYGGRFDPDNLPVVSDQEEAQSYNQNNPNFVKRIANAASNGIVKPVINARNQIVNQMYE